MNDCIDSFIVSLDKTAIILNAGILLFYHQYIGCGLTDYSSKYLNCFIDIDFNENVLHRKEKGTEINIVSNILKMPLKDNCLDAVLCVNAYQHLSNEEHRLTFALEVTRLLKHGGKFLFIVPSHEGFNPKGQQDLMV